MSAPARREGSVTVQRGGVSQPTPPKLIAARAVNGVFFT